MSEKQARLVKRGFDINNGVPYEVWDVGNGRGVYVDYFESSSKAFPVDMSRLMVDGEEMRSWPYDATGGKAIRELGYEPVEENSSTGRWWSKMAKISGDERREVAWRLRTEVSEGECIDYAVCRIINDVLGVNGAWGDKAARILADLIDPTCHLLPSPDGGFGCDRCYTWFPSMKEKPHHCPECGARVVEE